MANEMEKLIHQSNRARYAYKDSYFCRQGLLSNHLRTPCHIGYSASINQHAKTSEDVTSKYDG